ncbi:YqaJ viral recombinase family nuclease [Paenibacillus sp. FSL K6-1230]|uniref:YqaJ viral recombinase family nuclease n=1 Tax=Paenibacillus sp. FSL K6-1230 TaxID=2921603 RepID=UPI000399D0DF
MSKTILVRTDQLSHSEWLDWRRQGIGSSEAAAVCGKHPWRCSVHVYLDKIRELPHTPDTLPMKLGRMLKGTAAALFAEEHGWRLIRKKAIFRHPEHEFMLANIDRWIVGQHTGLLCKTVREYAKGDWEDRVPEHILIQCQHLMAVTGADHWWIALLIGGQQFRSIRVERDQRWIARIIAKEEQFWYQHVLPGIQPAWDGTPGSTELLKQLYPADHVSPSPLRLQEEADHWADVYRCAESMEKAALRSKTEAENRIKGMLGSAEEGVTDRYLLEWKAIYPRSGRQSPYRRFKLSNLTDDGGSYEERKH